MNFSKCRRVWETWFHLIVTAKCYSRETCIMNRTKTHERGSSCQWHFRGVGPQRLNIWTVSVSADQNLTPPCLPGKGLVLWVAPMTHPKRTAHPRHGVVSKQTYWSVPGGQNDEWMDGVFFDECHVWEGDTVPGKGSKGQYRTRRDEVAGRSCVFCSRNRLQSTFTCSSHSQLRNLPFVSPCHYESKCATWNMVPFSCRFPLCNCWASCPCLAL